MSDDLIKRLRKLADDMEKHATDDWDEHEDVATAANRIEQLERERKAMAMRDAGYDVYSKLESDLAKAVDALRDMCAEFRGHDLPYGSKAYHNATTVLNELSKQ